MVAAGLVGVLVMATGCVPGSDIPPPVTPTGPVSTDIPRTQKITLDVWDVNPEGGSNAALEALNAQFQRQHPNVTIRRVARPLNQLKDTLKLALTSRNPPDVVQANQGYADLGAFVRARLLQPVDRYAKAYGWYQRYPKQLLDLNRFTSDGRNWGSGDLYGVSNTGEIVGLYYNKQKLAKLGVAPPRTSTEFEAALAKAKAAGEVPIQLGNSDKFPATQVFSSINGTIAGKRAVRDLVFTGRTASGGQATWDTPEMRRSFEVLRGWADKKYLTPGADGISSDLATDRFGGGEGVFMITGTWVLKNLIDKGTSAHFGFQLPPPPVAGRPVATTGGEGLAWSIPSRASHPDVSAAYIEFITNNHAADVLAANGNLPIITPPSQRSKPGSLAADIDIAWRRINADDGLLPYLDNTTPTFYDTLTAGVQEYLAGRTDTSGLISALDSDYRSFRSLR